MLGGCLCYVKKHILLLFFLYLLVFCILLVHADHFSFSVKRYRSDGPLSEHGKRLEKTGCDLFCYFPIFSRLISSVILNYIGFLFMI